MNAINSRLNRKIDNLTRELVADARDHGIEIHEIEVEWKDGTFEAKVRYKRHTMHVPTLKSA